MAEGSRVAELLKGMSQEDINELKEALGVKKARAKKEDSPEYQAAKAHLESVTAENPDLIDRYQKAHEALRGIKGTRVVHATKRYDFDLDTGEITDRETKEHVAKFGDPDWGKTMRAAGYTSGQVAAVSKAVRTEAKKLEAATAPEAESASVAG